MTSNEIYKDREWLYEQYVIEEKGGDQIGEEVGRAGCTIRRWLKRLNIPIRSLSEASILCALRGDNHPNWKGGKRYTGNGYILITTDNGPKLEHRILIERKLKRSLETHEHIHHINFKKDDNKLENLYLCKSNKSHGDIKKTLFNLIPLLMEKEIIKFNKDKGEYYINE